MSSRTLRVAGCAGILFSILSLIVIPLTSSGPPQLGASGAAVSDWYAAHRLGFLIGNYLGVAAFFPGFLQLAVLTARVRRFEGSAGWVAPLVLSTGTFTYAVFACSLVVFQVLPFLRDRQQGGSTEAMGTVASVWFALDGLAALPLALAVGWATLDLRVLPRWFGVASWIVAALSVVMSIGAITATPEWIGAGGLATGIGFMAFVLWIGALGVIFLRLDPSTDPGAASG